MSAAPQHPSDLGYVGLHMTAEEFLALGETPERLELVDGVVLMSPSPVPRHQVFLRLILRQLEQFVDSNPGICLFPDTDVRLGNYHVYRPDIVVYRSGRIAHVPERLDLAPDLLIEILSPGTKAFDLTTKRDDYERFGVGEYWAVEPDTGRVRCYQRRSDLLVEIPVPGDSVESITLAGFVLDLRPLRELASNK